MASTEMACPEPRLPIESAWLTTLGIVTGWTVTGDQLHLLDGAGDDLAVLSPLDAGSVAGTWTLTEIGNGEIIALIESDATITLGEDGSLTGNTGCNTINGDHAVEGSSIRFGPVAMTKMACADPAAAEAERALLAALEGAEGWSIEPSGWLVLTDGAGDLLAAFTPAIVSNS